MGKRGPQPDLSQAAKGYPGKRPTKADRELEQAAKISALLTPAADASAELPAMLQDPKYAGAAQLWRRLAPELKRTGRLPKESEFYFVQTCIYAQEWVTATENLHEKGFVQSVKTVAGGRMERRRPQTFDRQQAFSNLMELSARFGLTPTDLYAVFKDQRLAVERNPDMFADYHGQAQPAAAATPGDADAPAQPTAPQSRVGSLSRLRSEPPGGKPN